MRSAIKTVVKKYIHEVETSQQREWIESSPLQASLLTDLMKFLIPAATTIKNLSKYGETFKKALEVQSKF